MSAPFARALRSAEQVRTAGAADALLHNLATNNTLSQLAQHERMALAHVVAANTASDPWILDRKMRGAMATEAGGSNNGLAWGDIPAVILKHQAGHILNHHLGFVHSWGRGPTYFQREADGQPSPIRSEELALKLAPYSISDGAGSNARPVPAARYYPQIRDTYDRCLYDPEGKLSQPGERNLNLWRDFVVQPARGSCRQIVRHIFHIICGKDRPAFKFLCRWLAHVVQYPGTSPESMIVLRSDLEGVGKSTLGHIMQRILGPHSLEVVRMEAVFGQFNDQLESTSFVLIEEGHYAGNHKDGNHMKAVVTSATLTINPKNRRAYVVHNTLHLMLCTNEGWAVPAGSDARRFLVLDVRRKMDRGYFDDLYKEIENGGVAAFHYWLQQIDLQRFNPRNVPATAALIEQQRRSADPFIRWIEDVVTSGEIAPGSQLLGGGFGQDVPAAVLHGAYTNWMQRLQLGRPLPLTLFGREMGKMGLTNVKASIMYWRIPDRAALLAAAHRRAGIRKLGY
jgi:hypothetical protein